MIAKGEVKAPEGATAAYEFNLPLRTEAELEQFVRLAWGVEIPNVQVHPDHTTPWRAFADAYFARSRVAVWHACVPGDAVVTTINNGAVLVADIELGTQVLGVSDQSLSVGIVRGKWETGNDDIWLIHTRVGDLRCNASHRVMIRRKFSMPQPGRGGYHHVEWRNVFVSVKEIRTGGRYQADLLVQPFDWDNRTVEILPSGRRATKGFVELCGLIIGDGSVRKYKVQIAHAHDAGYMLHYDKIAQEEFGKPLCDNSSNRCSWLYSKDVATELKMLGIGGTAHTKRVPNWVWSLPQHLKIAFLRGYVDSDGTIRPRGSIEWSSCNRLLLEDMRLLMLSIGVRVGRVIRRQRASIGQIMGRIVNRGDLWVLSCYEPSRIGTNDPKYSWHTPKHYAGEHDIGSGLKGVRYCRVLAVEKTGKSMPVYDIEVEGTRTFTCDSFIVHNSRGFGGKTFLLATLALTEAVTLKCDVNVLGGSGEQSANVLKYSRNFWQGRGAPRQLLEGEVARETRLVWGNTVRSLMASQTSVRGPHVPRLRLDEVDEMSLPILDAALGQTMGKDGVAAQTVISSTHHNADGTMTEALRRAAENDWPVHRWGYPETTQGWLDVAEVEGKRGEIPTVMWSTEFDLAEPAPESRAIQPVAVEAMFDASLGEFAGDNGEYVEVEPPTLDATYITGADWARKKDFTVIVTLRRDSRPSRVVAFERMNRRPWPAMIARFDERLARYGGIGIHDATGLGDVVDGHLRHDAVPVVMVGRARADLLSNYVAAVERGDVRSPVIRFMQNEHKYASVDDLYGSGHLPDSIAAMALAWLGVSTPRQEREQVWSPWRTIGG